MLRELQRYHTEQQVVDLIYISRTGQTSKRAVRIHSIDGERVKAYCYARRAYRVFLLSNILAVAPTTRPAAGW